MSTSVCRGVIAVALLLIGSIRARPAMAQDGTGSDDREISGRLKKLSLEQLSNIAVTSVSKEPVAVARTPAAVYVLTQEDLRESGVTTIPDALRLVPGVEVARIDSSKWSIGVRGFGSRLSRSVLVLIDGRSVYTQLFAGVYWEVQDTLLEDVDRIEVIRGPGGTIWGANAVNAVINIITKNAKDTKGILATTGGGNVDQGTGAFRYGGTRKDVDFRVYAKGASRGPEFHPDRDRFDSWQMGQAGFRADWNPPSRDTMTVQGDVYDADDGEKIVVSQYSPPSAASVVGAAEVSGGNVLARWNHSLSGGSDFHLQAYFDRTVRHEANFAESRNTIDIDFLDRLMLPLHQTFLWGLGMRFSPGKPTQVIPTIQFIPNQRTDKRYSGFVQDEIPLIGDRLSVTLGSKILHNIYTGFELQPSARLLWTPTANQSVWAGFTRGVRTPSRVDDEDMLSGLIAVSPPTFIRIIGDGRFDSERLLSYEAGYRSVVGSSIRFDVAVFYNNYDHLLSIEPGVAFAEASPSPAHTVIPYFIRNGVVATTYGIEIAPDWRPTTWWRLSGSYSFLHMDVGKTTSSQDSSTPTSTEGSSPQQQAVVQSSFQLPKHLEFGQTYRYVGALPAPRIPGYSTGDVWLGWRPGRFWELSVAGRDLLQPFHTESNGDPGPPVGIRRSVYAKITLRN